MSRKKQWYSPALIGLGLIILMTFSGVAFAAPDFMPVSDIKAGMHGIGKTVVSGNAVEEFGVEVLGIMKNKGPAGDLILIRTYGDVIDRTGGIVQGMSGSPVYIDGKLVGAVAYGWALTDHKIGMVTPIADMLRLWDYLDRRNRPAAAPEPVNLADSDVNYQPEEGQKPADTDKDKGLKPIATPVMAAGLSQQALSFLAEKLKPFSLVPYTAGDMPPGLAASELKPGSAVGVELMRGDISLSAIGTVTYVEGDKILAFGHPFLKRGNTGYFLSDAYIFTTVKGLENGFKVGAVGDLLGVFNQDRGAGIAGQTGKYPSIVPLRATIRDNTLNKSREIAVQLVNDEQLTPILAATSVYNSIDQTMDRTGPGTARVSFEIAARGMPGETLKRENMFYSPANIGEMAIYELHEILAVLAGNQFNPVDIMDVKVDIELSEERRTASIMEARADAYAAKPGDTIEIAVKLKPFRGEPVTRVVNYTIPKEQAPGPLTLTVRGGGMVPLLQLLLERQGLDKDLLKGGKPKNKSFADIIKEFSERDRNNDIVVEVMKMEADELPGGDKPKAGKAPVEPEPKPSPRPATKAKTAAPLMEQLAEKKNETHKNHVATDYIIEGDTQVLINVEAVAKKEK
ncbi:MAG: peptidase S55 SpoIVB [Negativicutes bacterium]|nr:peptidase S55 SpoIVB [Negativicutes bacterium]